MRAVLVKNMREKYAEFGEICAKICGIYAAYMWHYGNMWRRLNNACACVYVGQMRRNAEKCDGICV